MNNRKWDVMVIGAGPAGGLAARQLALAGAEVLLVERKKFPRPKVCGTCLNASAVQTLESVGLGHVVKKYGLPLKSLRVGLRGRFTDLSLPEGMSIPRAVLDAALVEEAQKAGVTFLPETEASLGLATENSRRMNLTIRGQQTIVEARTVVVAAGLAGRAFGETKTFLTRVSPRSRLGVGCVVEEFPENYQRGIIFMAVGRGGYVGLTHTVDGLNIASAFDPAFLKGQGGAASASAAVLKEAGFPEVPAIFGASWSGTLPLTRTTRPVSAERIFLIGDAAGYVEPFTGQGMAFALEGAKALIPFALRGVHEWNQGISRDWCREYQERVGARQWPCRMVASMARRPWLARLAFEIAGFLPTVPGTLVRYINRPLVLNPTR